MGPVALGKLCVTASLWIMDHVKLLSLQSAKRKVFASRSVK